MSPWKLRRLNWDDEEPPSAAAAIDGNDDLLREILRRLPARSLLRFWSVSKRWLSLISDPHFSLLWSRPNFQTLSGLFLRRLSHSTGTPKLDYIRLDSDQICHEKPPFNTLDFAPNGLLRAEEEEGIDILQSCNGLLLCSSFRLRHHSCNYYVYNPTTNKYRSLPRPIGFGQRIVRGVNLAFDPSKSPHYKVICVCSHSSLLRGIYWVQIYSSETHNWRAYDDIVLGPFDVVFDRGVFWNGAINWMSRESETSLYFDVDSEYSNSLPMPPLGEGERERNSGFFGVSSGRHLHLGLFSGTGNSLDVFEMERDFSKWLVKYRIDLEAAVASILDLQVPFPLPLDYCKFSILSLLKDEIEEESTLVIYIPGKLICYNLEEKFVKKVYDVKVISKDEYISPNYRWVVGYEYIESLICV